jgi:septal ring factor EnvC (AmiA/AmiB activator)
MKAYLADMLQSLILIPVRCLKQLSTILVILCLVATSSICLGANNSEKTKQDKAKQVQKKQPVPKQQAQTSRKSEKPKESLSKIHERIEKLKKDLDETKEAQADVADALKKSEKAISETNRKLFEIKNEHQKHSETLARLANQKNNLENTISHQENQLGKQLYQQYIHGKSSHLSAILDAKNPNEISRELKYLSYIARARNDLIQSMQHNLLQVTKLNEETSNTLKQVDLLKKQQESSKHNLEKEKENKAKVLEQLSAKINAQRNEINKLKRDEKSLSDLVAKLAQAAKVKATQKATPKQEGSNQNASAQGDPPTSKPVMIAKNETLPSAGYEGGNFSSLKGKLNLPVKGEVANRFGSSREDTGITWKGLFIRSAEGNEVKSIANGKIVFADWMRGFGNLLIIDHGEGYMSLYGNNQALLRKMGDIVKTGDTIASVGNTGGNETSGLYYELRKQSKPFDPMSWSVAR